MYLPQAALQAKLQTHGGFFLEAFASDLEERVHGTTLH
jgi:hypothetical protein